MHNKEIIDMAQRCVEEIASLRGQIQRLTPQAEAWNIIRLLVPALITEPVQGNAENLVWKLKKQIEELRIMDAPKVAE